MRTASTEDVVVLELLAVELELTRAVSFAVPLMDFRGDRPALALQRAVVGERALDAMPSTLGAPVLLGFVTPQPQAACPRIC